MLPKIWGESGWEFLHFVTLGYPENPTSDDKSKYYEYFNNLKYVLPCQKCKNNMSKHLESLPLTDDVLATRDSLVKWGIDLHNLVNQSTGKPMLTYDEAMQQINDNIAKKNNGTRVNYWLYLILLIVILVIIYFIYLLFRRNK